MTKQLFGGFSVFVIAGFLLLTALSAVPATMPTSMPVDEDDLWATSVKLDCDKAEAASGYMLGYRVRGHGPVTARPHATQKHGKIVLEARQELSRRGPDMKSDCPPSDRVIMAIQIGAEWCIAIYGRTSGKELTIFNVRAKDIKRRWPKLQTMRGCDGDGPDNSLYAG